MATARTRPRQPPTTPPAYPDHVGFILAEEDALKTMLEQTVTLPDNKGDEQPVRVWYRYPDSATAITYPFLTLDLIGIEPAYDLWTSEYDLHPNMELAEESDTGTPVSPRTYDPSTSPQIAYGDPLDFWKRKHYLTYRLIEQVGLWSKWANHDRLLSARMIRDIILPRPSWLFCPADGVWKRMEVLEWTPADIATQEGADKRIFRKMLTLSIQTDIPQDRLDNLALQPRIQKVLYRINERTTGTWLTGQEDTPTDVTTVEPTEWWVENDVPVVNPLRQP